MKRSEIIDSVKLMLGGSVLRLEISDDDIDFLINKAYRKIKPFITDSKFITKVFAPVIQLEDWVEDVLHVYRVTQPIGVSERLFDFEVVKLDRQSIIKNIIGSYPVTESAEDIKYRFVDHKLYLDEETSYQGMVTIEALVTPAVEEIQDERAVSWIESYTLALAKQVVGRIRSKFKSGSVPIELDGDTLLNEASAEIQQLEAEIQDRQFGPFTIVR